MSSAQRWGRVDAALRQRGEGDGEENERAPGHDEFYSRVLGPDWEPLGDGTYRYVGRSSSWVWEDQPVSAERRADDDRPED